MQRVEIEIAGCLDLEWAEWFEGFQVTHTDGGTTVLAGSLADQADLYGLIAKLRDLGAQLLSVTHLPPAVVGDEPHDSRPHSPRDEGA
jgi:hypothetical protein